jgi:S-adenosylmethionine decarboxylase
MSKKPVSKVSIIPDRSRILTASRRFDFDLRDRVAGIWDTDAGVPVIRHLVLEAVGVPPGFLKDESKVRAMVSSICTAARLTPVAEEVLCHAFPVTGGLTYLQVLSTSHIAVHTWPEAEYLHVDMVTCAETLEASDVESAVRMNANPTSVRRLMLRY